MNSLILTHAPNVDKSERSLNLVYKHVCNKELNETKYVKTKQTLGIVEGRSDS